MNGEVHGDLVGSDGTGDWTVDLALGAAPPEVQAQHRQRVATDPLAALEFAETVHLLEQLRAVTCEPSPAFAGKLHAVVVRAERLAQFRRPPQRQPWWLAAAAAVLTFALLRAVVPGLVAPGSVVPAGLASASGAASFSASRGFSASSAPPVESPAGSSGPLRTSAEVAFEESLAQIRRRLDAEGLRAAERELAQGVALPSDALGRWIESHNALVQLHRQGDLRLVAASTLRIVSPSTATLLARIDGLAAGVDADLAGQLGTGAPLPELALMARALWRAGRGPSESAAGAAAVAEVAERLGEARGPELVLGLQVLLEAAVDGAHIDAAARGGQRLLAELLQADREAWGRRLPELLQRRVPVAQLGEAGRVLALLPGLGLPPVPCLLARRLVLGVVRERLASDQGPEPLVALLYGFADLLDEGERDRCETALRRWHPARLLPDYVTVQQLADGMAPGRVGYTRLHGQLKRLCAAAEPADAAGRAGLLWCLSSALDAPVARTGQGE